MTGHEERRRATLPPAGTHERRLVRVGFVACVATAVPVVAVAWLLAGTDAAWSALVGAGCVLLLFTTLPAALAWAAGRDLRTLGRTAGIGALVRFLGYAVALLVLAGSDIDVHAPSLAAATVITSAVALTAAMLSLLRAPTATWIDATARPRSR